MSRSADSKENVSPEVARRHAVVLGGSHSALAVIRSLGRAGITTHYITDDHPQPGLSRYVAGNFRWRSAAGLGRVGELQRLARRHGFEGAVLFPCSDTEVRFVAENHAALSRGFRLLTMPWEPLRSLVDKRLLAGIATRAGIDSPLMPIARRDGEPGRAIVFPVIIKPTRRDVDNALTRQKAWLVQTQDELVPRLSEAISLMGADGVIVQEMIPGGGEAQFSYAAVCQHGAVIAGFTARRRRQYPIDFGFTSSLVEIAGNDVVAEAARRLVAATGYHGLVEIEFKHDVRDGRYKLLDVNPRPWAWIGLAETAGVDLAVLAYRLACGDQIAPVTVAARPARWMLVSRDLAAALQYWARGKLSIPGYLGSLAPRPAFGVFASDDIMPFLAAGPILVQRLLRRLMRRSESTPPIRVTPAAAGPHSIHRR